MEEGKFSEVREGLGFLEKDYLDVTTEKASDVIMQDRLYEERIFRPKLRVNPKAKCSLYYRSSYAPHTRKELKYFEDLF